MTDKPFAHAALADALSSGFSVERDLDRFTPSGRAIEFIPTMNGTGPGPGFVPRAAPGVGRYVRVNNLFTAWMQFKVGGASGADAWPVSNPYSLAGLPVTLSLLNSLTFINHIGNWSARDISGSAYTHGPVHAYNAGGGVPIIEFMYLTAVPTGFLTPIGGTNPWTWAVPDTIEAHIVAPCTDAFLPT